MSAAGYTNRIRTKAEARVRKVQYRYNDATNYSPLGAACAIKPDFTILTYTKGDCCSAINVPPIIVYYYDGGSAFSNIYDAAFPPPVFRNILRDALVLSNSRYSGGTASTVSTDVYDSGSASDAFPDILQSVFVLYDGIVLTAGVLRTLIYTIFNGGSALSNPTVVLDGGNSVPL